jgi:type IV pilus assembly protein PilQ
LDVKGARVRDVLTGLGKKGGVNVVMSEDVQGEVTLVVRNVAWEVALREVLRARGLESRREGNVLWVARAAELKAERQELFSETWCTEETVLPSDTFCKAPER